MSRKRPFIWAGIILLSILVLLPTLASPTASGAILRHLPLGWWQFLQRNVPQTSFNGSLVITGLACSILVIGISHALLRTFFSHIRNASSSGPPAQWPWRWTLCAYCAIWLLFTVAFGAAGVLRHTTWLMELREPWYKPRFYVRPELRMIDASVQELLMDNRQNLFETRRAFAGLILYRRELVHEKFNAIFFGDTNNQVAAYVIIPRVQGDSLFLASTPEQTSDIRPLSQLPQTLTSLHSRFPAPNGTP